MCTYICSHLFIHIFITHIYEFPFYGVLKYLYNGKVDVVIFQKLNSEKYRCGGKKV